MAAKVFSSAFSGLDCHTIEVEADISNGLPVFHIVGLGDTSVQESRERIRASIKNSGMVFPMNRKVVNLAPAQLRKQGSLFDLPIAISLLLASSQIPAKNFEDALIIGELSLEAKIKPVHGVIAICEHAKGSGFKKILLPYENISEASFIKGIEIIGFKNFKEIIAFAFDKYSAPPTYPRAKINIEAQNPLPNIIGMQKEKRCLSIAAAGRHNILFSGSPGQGKTILARSIRNLLPPMTESEILESTKIFSIAGLLPKNTPLVLDRPFREVHHSASMISVIGGGARTPVPGEITLAHNGVLFLDEIIEFRKNTLESLRQPLEDKYIHINRGAFSIMFPCNFILIGTMNPCPCGFYGDKKHSCKCTQNEIDRYTKKLSGPIRDRFDIFINVERSDLSAIFKKESRQSKEDPEVFGKIKQAIDIQNQRFKKIPTLKYNSDMELKDVKEHCLLDHESQKLLNQASNSLQLSNRSYLKTLKLARTIADLDNSEKVSAHHVAESLQYRL